MLTKVFKNYSKKDRNLSFLLIGVIVLVIAFQLIQSLVFNFKLSDSKKVYNEGVVGQFTQLNPLFTDLNSLNRDLSALVFSGLTIYNPNSTSFDPDLATFTINDNSTIFTFTLKDNLKWHDGKPITIDDVLFTYRTVIQNPGFQNAILQQSLEGVVIDIITDTQIQFTLPKPNSFFISQTTLGILPKHIYEDVPINQIGKEVELKDYDLLIGSGPYTFNKYEQIDDTVSRVSLKANKTYYNPAPSIKNIHYFIFPSDDDLLAHQHSLNAIPNPSSYVISSLDTAEFNLHDYLLPQYVALFLNTDKHLLQDRTVRVVLKRGGSQLQALTGLENKQSISRPFFQYEAINEITTEDSNLLKSLLEDEGWQLNSNNIYQKQEEALQLNLAVQIFSQNDLKNQEYQILVTNLVNLFKSVGIEIQPRFYEGEQFAKVLSDRDYDIVLIGHNLGDNLDSYSFWHSSQATPSGLNLSNYRNVATDSLLERVRTTSNTNERNELLIKINEKLVYDVPAIFLYTDKHAFAVDNKVKNLTILSAYAFISDRFFNIAEWELNTNK